MLTVIPTIDVEGVHGERPFEQMVLGHLGDRQHWGVYRLAKIFSKYNVSATFFIDVYEYTMWGTDVWCDLCRRLNDMGQDVQLHTHPGWRIDQRDAVWLQKIRNEKSYMGPTKDFMAKLAIDLQKRVLEHGIELLEKWTGKRPVAHRSGGYSINRDTVTALVDVGIPIDSSMYYAHQNSIETWSKNAIIEKNGLIELPVTAGCFTASLKINKLKVDIYRKILKTDLDVFDFEDFVYYVDQALEKNICLLNLFMHSYSLVNIMQGFSHMRPHYANLYKLEQLLEYLTSIPDVQFLNIKQFHQNYLINKSLFTGSDEIPEIPLRMNKIVQYGIRKIQSTIRPKQFG